MKNSVDKCFIVQVFKVFQAFRYDIEDLYALCFIDANKDFKSIRA